MAGAVQKPEVDLLPVMQEDLAVIVRLPLPLFVLFLDPPARFDGEVIVWVPEAR